MSETDYNPTVVNIEDIPMRTRESEKVWRQRFDEVPEGKAVRLLYNNRQRAHQVASTIRSSARYHKSKIRVRIIHAEPAIHDTDGWLVFWWKKTED